MYIYIYTYVYTYIHTHLHTHVHSWTSLVYIMHIELFCDLLCPRLIWRLRRHSRCMGGGRGMVGEMCEKNGDITSKNNITYDFFHECSCDFPWFSLEMVIFGEHTWWIQFHNDQAMGTKVDLDRTHPLRVAKSCSWQSKNAGGEGISGRRFFVEHLWISMVFGGL